MGLMLGFREIFYTLISFHFLCGLFKLTRNMQPILKPKPGH